MLKDTEIRTDVKSEDSLIQLNFVPTPEVHQIHDLTEWMERVPGVISAVPSLGFITLRAAAPPIPLDACQAEVQAVASTYFRDPNEKTVAVNSDFNIIYSQELKSVFKKNDSSSPVLAERVEQNEFDHEDLFLMTNFQIPEQNYQEVNDAIIFYKKRIHTVLVVDNGYGLHLLMSEVFNIRDDKDEVADKVISILNYHSSLFRRVMVKIQDTAV